MDETRIDTLTIEIGASSDKAVREIGKVQKSLNNLQAKSQQSAVAPKVSGVEEATRKTRKLVGIIQEASARTKERFKIKVDAKDADKASKKVGLLTRTLNAMKRIAFYRLIRTAIKEIGEAFREGQENAYWYSKTVGEQTKYISEAYDNLSSASFKMKNQLGASWATLKAAVIPVLLEIIRLATLAANAITQFFAVLGGKSTYMKAIDYTKDWAEQTESGAAAAKEWKKQLLGFDVINRLEEPSSGGGGASSPLADYENMFEESAVSENIAKISNILKPFFDFILDNIGKIAIGFAGWTIASGLLSKLGALGKTLSEITKGAIVLTLGAMVSYDAGYNLAKDFNNVGAWVEGLVGVLAAGIGGAIIGHAIAGPGGAALGFVIGVGVGVAFMLKGFVQGKLDEVVNSAFFNGEGAVKITELADAFEKLAKNVVKINEPIINAGNYITDIRNNKIQPAIDKINEIGLAISRGVTTAEEQIPNLVAAFEELKTGTKEILDEVYENVVRAVSGSLYDALSDAGVYVPELLAVLQGVKGEVDITFASLQEAYKGLSEEYAKGAISAETYHSSLVELSNKMGELIGYSDPVSRAFSTISGELKGINWESEDAKNNAFTIIKNAAEEASSSVNEAYNAINENINIMRGWSSDPVFQNILDEIFMANEATREAQRKEIGDNLQLLFDQIQSDLIDKTQNVIDAASEEWNNMSGWEKFFSGMTGEAAFVNASIENYQKNIMDPILSDMQAAFENLGAEGTVWASDAMSGILDNMFSYHKVGPEDAQKIISFSAGVGKDVEKAFAPLADQFDGYGGAYIDGLREGMDRQYPTVISKINSIASGLMHSVETDLDIHSPSGVAIGYGENFIEGFTNGMTNKESSMMSALSKILSGMLSVFQNFINNVITGYNDMLGSIQESMNSVSNSNGKVKTSKARKVEIQTIVPYGSGGFPEDGLFFANHNELVGQFSNGRTAVANNEQIVDGISDGVYNAVLAAMGNNSDRPVSVRVYLDSREIKTGQQRLARVIGG